MHSLYQQIHFNARILGTNGVVVKSVHCIVVVVVIGVIIAEVVVEF